MNTNDIADELLVLDHKVRNIINAGHKQIKELLNPFFVDLEPANNNLKVFKIQKLQNCIIAIESPRKAKNTVQCTRCQMYRHTKTYCNRPFVCGFKCGGFHISCKKNSNTPALYALYGGPHPEITKAANTIIAFIKIIIITTLPIHPPNQEQRQIISQLINSHI